jgi:microcystin-dependent protein
MSRDLVSQNVSQNLRKIVEGTITMWPSNTIPKGWLLCDGTGYATTAYPALYATIGTVYGSTGGFQVPVMRTRVPYATGSAGATGGVSTVTLSAAESGVFRHSHAYNDFSISYGFNGTFAESGGVVCFQTRNTWVNEPIQTDRLYVSGTGYPSGKAAAAAHTNLQPYLLLNFIIKT